MLSLRSLVVAVAVGALFAGGLTAQSGSRFDATVRGDFFAGLTGDVARLQQAMAACERMLADDPANAEALVWHGSGLYFQAGQLFRAGDAANGAAMAGRARQEMDSAVARDPDNIGVRIPRGATLLEAARQMGPGAAAPLLTTAIEDYEHVLKLQERVFSTLSDHAKGELLLGLADG